MLNIYCTSLMSIASLGVFSNALRCNYIYTLTYEIVFVIHCQVMPAFTI